MLEVLFSYAKEAEKQELLVREAKEALTLMLPANNVQQELSNDNDYMTQLRDQLSADEMAKLNAILKPAMQGLLNDLVAKVKEGNV